MEKGLFDFLLKWNGWCWRYVAYPKVWERVLNENAMSRFFWTRILRILRIWVFVNGKRLVGNVPHLAAARCEYGVCAHWKSNVRYIAFQWRATWVVAKLQARIVRGVFYHESYEFIECGALSFFTTNLTNLSNVGRVRFLFYHELYECRRSGHPSLHSYNSARFVWSTNRIVFLFSLSVVFDRFVRFVLTTQVVFCWLRRLFSTPWKGNLQVAPSGRADGNILSIIGTQPNWFFPGLQTTWVVTIRVKKTGCL